MSSLNSLGLMKVLLGSFYLIGQSYKSQPQIPKLKGTCAEETGLPSWRTDVFLEIIVSANGDLTRESPRIKYCLSCFQWAAFKIIFSLFSTVILNPFSRLLARYSAMAELSKCSWYPKRKYGDAMHFSEISKLRFSKQNATSALFFTVLLLISTFSA